MAKLVRDKIHMLANREGESYKPQDFALCKPEEYEALLFKKLDEEIAELHHAMIDRNPADVTEEIADVMEVLFTIHEHHGDGMQAQGREGLIGVCDWKRRFKGGFDAGVVLLRHRVKGAK